MYVNDALFTQLMVAAVAGVVGIALGNIAFYIDCWKKQEGPNWLLDLKVKLFNLTHSFCVRSLNEYDYSKEYEEWIERCRNKRKRTYTVNCYDKKTGEWFVLDENDEQVKSVVDCLPIAMTKYTFIKVDLEGNEIDVTKERVAKMFR